MINMKPNRFYLFVRNTADKAEIDYMNSRAEEIMTKNKKILDDCKNTLNELNELSR